MPLFHVDFFRGRVLFSAHDGQSFTLLGQQFFIGNLSLAEVGRGIASFSAEVYYVVSLLQVQENRFSPAGSFGWKKGYVFSAAQAWMYRMLHCFLGKLHGGAAVLLGCV